MTVLEWPDDDEVDDCTCNHARAKHQENAEGTDEDGELLLSSNVPCHAGEANGDPCDCLDYTSAWELVLKNWD